LAGEHDKERAAISAVAGLLAKIAVKQSVARQLLDVYERLGERGIRDIMADFEGVVADHARRLPPAAVSPSGAGTPPGGVDGGFPADALEVHPKLSIDPSALFEERARESLAAEGLTGAGAREAEGEAAAGREGSPAEERHSRRGVRGPEEAVTPGETRAPADEPGIPPAGGPPVPPALSGEPLPDVDRRPHFEPTPGAAHRPQHLRIPFQYDDDDVVYVHGVTIVPVDEKSEPKPFMLEEKGLDSREFAFAMDRGGLRFFLSRLDSRTISVSKGGLLLSGKQESLRLRGVHESVLNDLRAHGVVLPFEFGTIARSKEELIARIEERLYDLHDAVDDMMATSWWKLTVSMLDAKLAGIIGTETGGADRERRLSARPQAAGTKIDIKVLERILGRQKRIAETVHEEMKKVADRTEVEMMVGFSSGTTDDWKPILKASYLVPPSRVHKLHRAITEIQYRHLLFDLMLTLTGDQPPFSLHDTR
jgi:hypothetical protein